MFKVALFIEIPNWGHPRCPSVGGWLNKLPSIHSRNALLQQDGIWGYGNLDESPENSVESRKPIPKVM